MTATDLAGYIRSVKAQVTGIPVTYADVWEYWLRHREIYEAVDFITIHILPYWEDFPIRARYAAAHVDSIRKRVAVAFPAKEILIGETGWPSAGRMREGALPSRTNQARVVSEVLELARREKYRVNLIEAYDQPWKRAARGDGRRLLGPVRCRPARAEVSARPGDQQFSRPGNGRWARGSPTARFVFLVALLTQRRKPWPPRWTAWVAVGLSATAGGALLGIAADKLLLESFGTGRLAALGHAVRRRRADAGVRRRRTDRRPAAADLRRIDRTGAYARSRAACRCCSGFALRSPR